MWYYSLTVCIAFACLLCSSASGFSSSDYDSSSSSQFSSDLRKARRDPRWMLEDPSFLFDKRTGIDVGTWPESEAVSSLSRQLFGDKAADSSAEQLLEEDMSVVGKKGKRGESHSLSIVNPLDVLRQRLLLDMARRRMKENQKQISENAAILHQLGKRASDRRIQVSSSENFEV